MKLTNLMDYDIDDKKLAYIAGFIDGEGCIYSNGGYLGVIVSNTVRAPLEFIEGEFGGSISIHIYAPPNKRKPIYNWKIFGRSAAIVLQFLLPYLIVKKEHALLGMQLVMVSDKTRRNDIALELKRLNS